MNRTVYAACGLTLALGLVFVFVRAPHPWGWEGFDHYHELALAIAAGQPFPTMEVPWGYAYFLAAFYRAFGDHPAIPLVVQVALNACIPLLVFAAARRWFDDRTAAIAAAVTGVFSFNTVYASTQTSDAVCTVIFMAAVVAFVRAREEERKGRKDRKETMGFADFAFSVRWFALVGVLAGLAPQFRPNLILIPLLFAVFMVVERRSRRRVMEAALLVACSAAMLAPWVVRNYRLTRSVLPTSVHGGVQLWYGTLQTGPYLTSRAHNPRSVFEGPAFDYTSLTNVPLVVTADVNPCVSAKPVSTTLWYWTDSNPARVRVASTAAGGHLAAELPETGGPAVLYYYLESICDEDGRPRTYRIPELADGAPFVFFVSRDHLGDLDVHGDILDVFDLIRLVRHAAWHEDLLHGDRLHAAGVGDVTSAVEALTPIPPAGIVATPPPRLIVDNARATLVLHDGSSIGVPRDWNGRITDTAFDGGLALTLMHSTASLAELRLLRTSGRHMRIPPRGERDDVSINRVFYRWEPHMMRRYSALALDNIGRDPLGFAAACLYRSVRLFVVQGTDDRSTAHQFDRSRAIYAAATVASVAYLLLFVAGVAIAWREGYDWALPLLLIAYVPATLAPVLTNMRYTVTVQPIVFMFVAVTVSAFLRRRGQRAAPEESGRAGSRTARQL